MCGRYQFTSEGSEDVAWIVRELENRPGAKPLSLGEIRPGCKAPVLLSSPAGLKPELYIWGYRTPKSLVFNARSETAAEKPMFRDGISGQRCVVPSTGFFEWDGDKRKYLFTMPNSGVLYMAAIYAVRGGIPCYCILTTQANSSMRAVHDRMPLVLEKGQLEEWMDDPQAADRFLKMTPPMLEKRSLEDQFSLW